MRNRYVKKNAWLLTSFDSAKIIICSQPGRDTEKSWGAGGGVSKNQISKETNMRN